MYKQTDLFKKIAASLHNVLQAGQEPLAGRRESPCPRTWTQRWSLKLGTPIGVKGVSIDIPLSEAPDKIIQRITVWWARRSNLLKKMRISGTRGCLIRTDYNTSFLTFCLIISFTLFNTLFISLQNWVGFFRLFANIALYTT